VLPTISLKDLEIQVLPDIIFKDLGYMCCLVIILKGPEVWALTSISLEESGDTGAPQY
jgi:hypothetical protein